ncbi:hypothetical protein BT67DRAFT_8398 [Trichocladium antarcticum]|uniref:Uncharacterized protein n=1 Tax=Trichocladium antarcticum TaxID=1450529 RepID=A0AAN6USI6_9PEZI|nr:hypothetical protein BT67DRAFT_8398 [Trichocladium antarcticum]
MVVRAQVGAAPPAVLGRRDAAARHARADALVVVRHQRVRAAAAVRVHVARALGGGGGGGGGVWFVVVGVVVVAGWGAGGVDKCGAGHGDDEWGGGLGGWLAERGFPGEEMDDVKGVARGDGPGAGRGRVW